MEDSTRIDLWCGVFSERMSSSGEIAKNRPRAFAGAISGKKGLPGCARINAKASGDILPLPVLLLIEASRLELTGKVFYVVAPSCLSRGEPRRFNALRYVDSSYGVRVCQQR